MVLTVELRDWTRAVTIHATRAAAMERLREALGHLVPVTPPLQLDDEQFIEAVMQEGNIVHLESVDVPEDVRSALLVDAVEKRHRDRISDALDGTPSPSRVPVAGVDA